MSSLTRRLQIRAMKDRGYRRTNYRIAKGADGQERQIRVARRGLILRPDDTPVGYRWPRAAIV